mmetsp:Transcript_34922/g.38994  ORF Transcript_34922/g.38994 Transcript_34922/m.38994 type:complete len:561 (+) Transcript_34922:207-1889(+)
MKNLYDSSTSNLTASSSSSSSSGCPFALNSKSDTVDDSNTTTSSSSSSSERNSTVTCPYVHALQNDGDDLSSSADSSSSSTIMTSSPPMLPLSTAWKECPAFANQSCPFKDAKSPEEVSHICSKMLPPSHIDETRPTHTILIETLAHFHRDQAMEELSVAATMSRLALAREGNNQEQQHGIEIDQVEEYSDTFQLPVPLEEKANLSPAIDNALAPQQPRRQSRRLSEALKSGTEEAHQEAENVHFVKNFIQGKIDRNLYGLFVAQLFHVYIHLERALDEYAPKYFSDCHFPEELKRVSALQDDINFWGDGDNLPLISPATRDYIDRIDAIAKERPILLLAHAYTRYLGDLSGGKILARVAKRALMLDSGPDGLTEGLAFYDFPLLRGSVIAFKDRYRQALNDLEFDDDIVGAIVQEANVAFLLNMRLFEELDVIGSVPQAKVRQLEEVYSYVASSTTVNESSSTANNEAGKKSSAPCPFLASSTTKEEGKEKSSAICPFLTSSNNKISPTLKQQHEKSSGKVCPWPFILLHDPYAGMWKWQTWLIIGLLLVYVYQQCILF